MYNYTTLVLCATEANNCLSIKVCVRYTYINTDAGISDILAALHGFSPVPSTFTSLPNFPTIRSEQ